MADIDFTKVTGRHVENILGVIFGLIIAPIWFIYQFANPIFQKTDTFKLIIIALGISFPILFITMSLYRISLLIKDSPRDRIFYHDITKEHAFSKGCLLTALVLYAPSFGFYNKHVTLDLAIQRSTIAFTGFILILILDVIITFYKKSTRQ